MRTEISKAGLLCAALSAVTVGAVGARARPDGPAPEGGEAVSFLPAPGGEVGAFLLAGPFERPRDAIERGAPAREGASWRLVVTEPSVTGATLGGAADHGYIYAQVDLPRDADAPRHLFLASSSEVSAWIDGRPQAGARAYERRQVRLAPGTGARTLLLRMKVDGAPVRVEVLFGSADPLGRLNRLPTRLRLADSSPQRLRKLMGEALGVRLYPAFPREGGSVQAELRRTRACPEVKGELAVEFRARPEGALVPSTQGGVPLNMLTPGRLASARFRVAEGGEGRFEVDAAVTRGGEPFARVSGGGFTVAGLGRTTLQIERRAKKLLQEGREDASRRPIPRSAVAYALLQAEKARLSLSREGGADTEELGRDIERAERALGLADEARDFQAGRTGFMERAYFSEVDDSAQPYLAYVPTKCRKGTGPWPLVVYLHGYVPTYDKDAWVGEYPALNAAMEAEGCILAVPFGRSNTDFRMVGEDDVMRVIEEMKRAYPVDVSRIYMYGYSMGGLGAWTILVHYPDVFAAAVVISGQSDHYLWHKIDRERFPPWWRHLIDTDSPLGLAENIKHVPVRAYHGRGDYVVVTEHSRRMVDRLKELGGEAQMFLIDGGHWALFDAVLFTRGPVAWMAKHRLPEGRPERFRLEARHPRYASAWGVNVGGFRRWMEPAVLDVAWGKGRSPAVSARNASLIQVKVGPAGAPGSQFKALDGGTYTYVTGFTAERGAPLWLDTVTATLEGQPAHEGVFKNARLCGPVKEAYRSPFAVVHGTKGSAEESAELHRNARRFVKEWSDFAKGRPPMYADTAVTPEIAKRRNLVLFGGPSTNAVLSRIAHGLPIKWDGSRARIAGRTYPMRSIDTGKGRGLLFVYPNPEAPGRLVVVFSGLYWGGHLSVNHKWDHVPDFILFEEEKDLTDSQDPLNKPVVAGFFGPDWSLKRGRIFEGMNEVRPRP